MFPKHCVGGATPRLAVCAYNSPWPVKSFRGLMGSRSLELCYPGRLSFEKTSNCGSWAWHPWHARLQGNIRVCSSWPKEMLARSFITYKPIIGTERTGLTRCAFRGRMLSVTQRWPMLSTIITSASLEQTLSVQEDSIYRPWGCHK